MLACGYDWSSDIANRMLGRPELLRESSHIDGVVTHIPMMTAQHFTKSLKFKSQPVSNIAVYFLRKCTSHIVRMKRITVDDAETAFRQLVLEAGRLDDLTVDLNFPRYNRES